MAVVKGVGVGMARAVGAVQRRPRTLMKVQGDVARRGDAAKALDQALG